MVLASTYPRWQDDTEPGFVHELSRRLASTFEVMVLCPHAPGAARRESMDGVQVSRFRYAPLGWQTLVNRGGLTENLRRRPWLWLLVPAFLLGMLGHCIREGRRFRPDVIHAHWIIPQAVIVACASLLWRRQTPVMVTSHGADLFGFRGAIALHCKRMALRVMRAFSVVSEAMIDPLADLGVPRQSIRVMPMGVDLQHRFVPQQDTARAARQLLFVGRLVEKKGCRHLIAAMPYIVKRFSDVELLIAGDGPEREELEGLVEALGVARSVRFLGAVSQAALPDLYRRSGVLVVPFVESKSGDQDGLGLVLVEAIGCECPVIAGAVSANQGLPVVRVRAERPGELADAVCEMFTCSPEERRRRARAARLQVLERFDWEAVAAGYARELLALVGDGERPRAMVRSR